MNAVDHFWWWDITDLILIMPFLLIYVVVLFGDKSALFSFIRNDVQHVNCMNYNSSSVCVLLVISERKIRIIFEKSKTFAKYASQS